MADNKDRNSGTTSGKQANAEGMHGDRTHAAFLDQIQQGEHAPKATEGAPIEGRHRMTEDREQHDEAEKNSEKGQSLRHLGHTGDSDNGGADKRS